MKALIQRYLVMMGMLLLTASSGFAAPSISTPKAAASAANQNASAQTAHMAEVRTMLELHHLERTLIMTNQGDLPPHKKSAIRYIDAAIKELKLQLLSERGNQPMNRAAVT